MDPTNLLVYYIVKRAFLFFDEWLFYFVLFKMFTNRHYFALVPVLIYGICAISTSYVNIDRLEGHLANVHQMIFLTEVPFFEHMRHFIEKFVFSKN
jgi:hypothetical protein